MNNYSIDTLIVEITRRCNLKCEHCIQGDAQNITITKEIIDKLFHQVDKVKEIRIAGGETLLEIETLEYMLQAIDLYDLETTAVSLITNGTIRDSRVIDVFDDFVKKKNNRYVSMLISDDNFHDIDQSKKTLRFYSSINSNNKILIKLFSDSGEPNVNNGAPLTYSGRAITYIEKNGFKDVSNIVIKENSIRTHQICVKENTIKCMLQLSANGGIGLTLYADYETSDKLSIGNIQQCSFKDIINNHNYNCPYLCDECYNETLNISAPICDPLDPPYLKEFNKITFSISNKRIEASWRIRKLIQKTYPLIPIQEVIRITPVISLTEYEHIINSIQIPSLCILLLDAVYRKDFPHNSENQIRQLSLSKYKLKVLESVLCESNSLGIYPFLSETELLASSLFIELDKIEKDINNKKAQKPEIIDVCKIIADSYDEKGIT
ncbi:MAG: radical SAM protein [Clostridia bacterium]|nr:radical SAM protein [Clostridia bacterium]